MTPQSRWASRAAVVLVIVANLLLAVPGAQAADAEFAIPATDEGLPGAGPIRRYDWFRDLWQAKRSSWAEQVKADQNAVVFLGDSITQGWGDSMGRVFGGLKVANRGISGDTTRGMLIRLEEDVLSLNPRAVVLLMGTNDLEEKAEPETIAGNLKLIIAALKKHDAKMPIVLCKVFPSSETKSRPAVKIKRVNELYAAAAHGDPQVVVLETWLLFADENGNAKEAEFPDLLHPNEAGYAKWAAALRPIFATLGYLETEPDNFQNEPGFVSLFNGKDLTGWGFREPKAAFDGQTASNDGRYVAMNGRLVVTTPPEGRRVQQLWTTREFPSDFVLKLEFRATPYADSGVFIRGPQLQCRDYLLAGPYTELKKYRPQEWNELVVTVKGTTAHCTCNGEVLNDALALPATGGIGLEGDRGQMEYRRIRIKESAAGESPPSPEKIALWSGEKPASTGAVTVHLPSQGNGAAVVICPGGGYGGLVTGPEGHGIAAWLNAHGIAGIVLEYELPRGRSQVPMHDVQRAIRLTRASAEAWKLDAKRIGVMGFSAGGHLASTAGTHFDAGDPQAADPVDRASCRPDFMILVYPVITMGEKTHAGSRRNLLGDNPTEEAIRLFSNETQVTKETPPAYLAHAIDDAPVPPENSRMFHAALQAHGVASEYLELPSGGHGLNGYQGPMWDAWQAGSLQWLAEVGMIPKD